LYYQRPLFRDLSPNVYLAPEYDERYGDILREFGTELLAWKDILSLLKEDLASPTSRLRNTAPADPWHKKCSQLLLFPFKSDQMRSTQDILKRLAIIPLVGGTQWTHAHCVGPGTPQNIYFPKTKGISIPIDISLKLVDPLALKFQSRRKLFKSIGVVDCPPATVMGKIQETHQWRSEQLTCEGVYTHFRYLFNFHPNPQTIDEWMHAPIESEMMKNTSSQLYFPSTEEYHTHQLIEIPKESRVCFLAKSLVNLEKPEVCRNMRSWIDWLEIALAARYFPALNDEDTPEELSPVILTVLEKKPEKFLGLLKAHWDSEYRATVEKNPALRNILAECNVLCKLGATAKLSSTYLPYATTREAIRRFNVEYGFPLLHLPVTLENSNSRDWEFLNVFGVRVQPTLDLDFYLLILKKKILERSTASLQEVTQIYIAIAAIIRAPERGRIR
jgi:hypothetical protein